MPLEESYNKWFPSKQDFMFEKLGKKIFSEISLEKSEL